MIDLFCSDCTTHEKVYPIITNEAVEPLCSKCIVQRETVDTIKESGRTELEFDRKWPHLTVGDLKDSLNEVPDTAPVLYQRIGDVYFEEHGWTAYEMEFEYRDSMSEYILSWSAYWHSKKNAFVINAHY